MSHYGADGFSIDIIPALYKLQLQPLESSVIPYIPVNSTPTLSFCVRAKVL